MGLSTESPGNFEGALASIWRATWFRLTIGTLISLLCLYLAFKDVPLGEVGQALAGANYAWILLAALGSVGYSTVDSIAAQSLQAGLETAIRYNIYESSFTLMIYFLILRAVGDKGVHAAGWDGWKWPVVAAGFLFGAYSLVLWAFQLDPHASYVVALRQFSIVIGVVTGAMFFHEPAPWLRAFASVVILIGVLCIAFAK